MTESRQTKREQAALRRLATLVAEGVQPAELFAVVAEEVGRVVDVPFVSVTRYEPDDTATECAVFSSRGPLVAEVGKRWSLEGTNVLRLVRERGEPARIDDYTGLEGEIADAVRRSGIRSTVATPITVSGSLWGAMVVRNTERLPGRTETRLAAFTELLAIAIANARSHETLAELADEQAALRRVATLIARGGGPEPVFRAVADEAVALLGCDTSAIVRFGADGTAMVLGGHAARRATGERFEPDLHFVVAAVRDSGKVARFDTDDPAAPGMPEPVRAEGIRSALASPVIVDGKLWGAVTVGSLEGALPVETEQRLADFTDLVATAVANAHAREQLMALAEEQAALRRVATLVARDAPSTEVFDAVATEVGRLFDTDITVVGRYDGDGVATAIGSWSSSGRGVPVGTRSAVGGHNVLTKVAETGKPARVDGYDDASGEAAEIARRYGWTSSIAAPIVVEDRVWGVMLVATERSESFPAGAEDRLAAFTDLISTALANAQAHDEVLRFGDEQAALGRVATLVAAGAAAELVFSAVVDEVSSLIGLELIELVRYDGDAKGTVIAASNDHLFRAGTVVLLDDASLTAMVARTGRIARIDDYANLKGDLARRARSRGVTSAIGAPLTVEGRIWGAIIAVSIDPEPIPERCEVRLAQITELLATAVANADARHALERVAAEQATLRRIATLVAEGLQPQEIFAVVIEEVGRLFGTDLTVVGRFEGDPPAFVAVALGNGMQGVEVATSWALDDPETAARVYRSGLAVRVNERLRERSAALADTLARLGVVSTVSSPIVVEGRLWGAVFVSSREGLPADTEERLTRFTGLVATAVANAESRSELAASRRRIVAASDEARRRIERDLHDGTQQRLVSLGLAVRAAEAGLPPERDDLRAQLSGVATGLVAAVEDLQEISRGIHPAILSKGGLVPALRTLAHRSAIPVDLDISADVRLEEPIEVAAYFVASEALANAAKHSEASRVDVSLELRDGSLLLSVRDDGVGGADAARGSGLVGLADRVEALGGSIRVSSRPGAGTQITAEFPLELKLSPAAGPQAAVPTDAR